jgi:hypothetical protein
MMIVFFLSWHNSPKWDRAPFIEALRSHSVTPHSVDLLWTKIRPSQRDLNLITDNTRKRQTCNFSAGIEPAIPASERPPTLALDHAATGIGMIII